MNKSDSINEIITIIKGIFLAFENHNPDGIEVYMHPDATVWDVFTPHLIRGKHERDKFHADDQEQMQARGPLKLNIEEPEVDIWSDFAIAKYYLHYEYQSPNPTKGSVRITDIFHQVNKTWTIVHHHEGSVPEGVPKIEP